MAEKIDLTTPDQIQAGTSDYQIVSIILNNDTNSVFVSIGLKSVNGYRRTFTYNGDEALQMMITLNKANLSVKSLHRRIFEKLVADGKLVGAVTGAPD